MCTLATYSASIHIRGVDPLDNISHWNELPISILRVRACTVIMKTVISNEVEDHRNKNLF